MAEPVPVDGTVNVVVMGTKVPGMVTTFLLHYVASARRSAQLGKQTSGKGGTASVPVM